MLAASAAFAKSPPPGTGFQDVKTNVLIMLDTSGSMDGTVPTGVIEYPYGVAFDSSGNIYIASKDDSNVIKYTSSGTYVTDWGSYGTGSGKFKYIYAIAVATISGTDYVFVADQNNGRVQKFTTDGTYVSQFDTGSSMKGMAMTADASSIYVINSSGKVQKYNSSGTAQGSAWSNSGGTMIALDTSGNVYVTENGNERIRKYNSSGTLQMTISTSYKPMGVAVGLDGSIYVSNYSGNKIYKYNTSGSQVATYGSNGTSLGKWKNPAGIARDASGNIWVADYNNDRIQGLSSNLLFTPPAEQSKMDQAKIVIKNIVSNTDLTDGANFGLMTWNSSATMRVNVSSSGAASIYSLADSLSAGGYTVLDAAMTLAKSYLTGVNTPFVPGAWCQNTVLVVISDGEWTDNTASTTAKWLYDTYQVKTFAIGFNSEASETGLNNYIALSQIAGTYPDSPVFATDWQGVYDAVSHFVLQIISSNLTFSAPTVMPGVTNNDHILQATFKQKVTHQWKGSFSKYEINSDGSVGSLLWEAGSLLAVKPEESRNIWTVGTGLTTSLNNFTTDNIDGLRSPMNENLGTAMNDANLTNLISFVRGADSYNEYSNGVDDEGSTIITGERWKLADIYHTRAVAVGPPSAITSDTAATNTESYYRATNGYAAFQSGSTCGGVCSARSETIYVGANDGMLHAFDSATGQEKWAFIPPSLLPNFKDMISSTAGQSVSIYGVDGTAIVKDIYYGGAWRTVLISGLRQGGKSYFALDITNPDSPQHLFTINYNSTTSRINYWAADGTRTNYTSATAPAAYNFFTLGESWSTPNILLLPVGTSGAMKWTAVFGGGYNGATNTSYGAQLFVIDLENNGQIIRNIAIGDTISTNGIASSVPPTVTAITGDSAAAFTATGAIIYLSDLEGKLWKVNLTTNGTLYDTTKLFNTESTSTNARLSFQQTAAALDTSGTLIQYYGTGDMQNLGTVDSNIANRAYGVKDTNFPNYTSISTMATASNLANVSGGICPTSSQQGWYFNLNSNEKITAKATVKNNIVLFPRYTANNTDICSAGIGSISEHNFTCGTTLRTTSLGSGVPTEAVLYKNKIYIGISTDQAASGLGEGFTKQGNLIVGTPVTAATGKVKVESWWEDF